MTDYIAAYRAYLSEEKRASANTLSSYIRDLTQFQSWLITNGTADLRKVKKETINEYLPQREVSRHRDPLYRIHQVLLQLHGAVRRS